MVATLKEQKTVATIIFLSNWKEAEMDKDGLFSARVIDWFAGIETVK